MTLPGPPRNRALLVLYASQTGNAEWIARHIREEAAARRGFDAACASADDFIARPPKGVPNFDAAFAADAPPPLLVLVCSTTGDGDVPDNGTKFYRFLKRDPKRAALEGRDYVLLGLGDTNYDNFCGGAKRLDRELQKCGMKCVAERGWADDATGIEAVVDPWIANLWHILPDLVWRDPVKVAALKSIGTSPKRDALSAFASFAAARKKEEGEKAAAPPAEIPLGVVSNGRVSPVVDIAPPLTFPPLAPEFRAPTPPIASRTPSVEALSKFKQLTNVTKSPASGVSLQHTGRTHEPHPYPFRSSPSAAASHSNPFLARITTHRILTGDRAPQPVHEVGLEQVPWSWQAGDALAVLAPNPPELVAGIIRILCIEDADVEHHPFPITGEKEPMLTVRSLLTWLVDLPQFPTKSVLRLLADMATVKDDRKRLLFLCSKEGINAYRALKTCGATLLDVLSCFPSCVPPAEKTAQLLAALVEHAARLQPRNYSFAGSPLEGASGCRIAFNEQEWTTSWGSPRRGIASGFLEALAVAGGGKVPVFPRVAHTNFEPPADEEEHNVLLVATGTGITPFRGFLQQRVRGGKRGKWWLVYGCRFPGGDGDAVYLDELRAMREQGVLDRLDVVYSREPERSELSAAPPADAEMRYVQHALRAHGKDVHAFLKDESSVVYTCGDAKTMGKGVLAALGEIFEECEGWEAGKGEGVEFWMEKRAERGGFRRDVWG
ncbi:hypothetical protein DFJ74DRAFT_607211 [Hyaloraphidium curvatum]|nr:hypothetical protein DFJ74DRAFT_607211 [Hyaloraphidium curvatum]